MAEIPPPKLPVHALLRLPFRRQRHIPLVHPQVLLYASSRSLGPRHRRDVMLFGICADTMLR